MSKLLPDLDLLQTGLNVISTSGKLWICFPKRGSGQSSIRTHWEASDAPNSVKSFWKCNSCLDSSQNQRNYFPSCSRSIDLAHQPEATVKVMLTGVGNSTLAKAAVADVVERQLLLACLLPLRYLNPKCMKSVTNSPLKVEFQCDRAGVSPKLWPLTRAYYQEIEDMIGEKQNYFGYDWRTIFIQILILLILKIYNCNGEKQGENSK